MDVLRYAAFSDRPDGGNPAGIVLDATGASDAEMLAVAAEVGYSETAFVFPDGTAATFPVRYFSPLAEVPFCGHATIATAVALAERNGPQPLTFQTPAGPVAITSSVGASGAITATLRSVETRTEALTADTLATLLEALRWSEGDLDADLPPRVAYAGAWHPVIAATSRARLGALDYDFTALADLMTAREWTTVDLVWRESSSVFHARNPFPPGGVVEDPATGAAAAAFGGYLRELGLVAVPATVTIHQGDDFGRPGVLTVGIDSDPGISVTGTAVAIS